MRTERTKFKKILHTYLPFFTFLLLGLFSCRQMDDAENNQEASDTSQARAQQQGTVSMDSESRRRADAEMEKSLEEMDPALAEATRNGATMEEIARLKGPVAGSPEEALRALKAGNSRFFSGNAKRPELSANERRAQILSQSPFAVVLGCSDSRVPIELVYDQGLGDLFVIRVAGNFIDSSTVGSIEYGVRHLKSHIVVIMGHEGCGAVKAALLPEAEQNKEPASVQYLLNHVTPAVRNMPDIKDKQAFNREAVVRNVLRQREILKQNPVISSAIKSGTIMVVGAYYEISSGAVDFFEDEEDVN